MVCLIRLVFLCCIAEKVLALNGYSHYNQPCDNYDLACLDECKCRCYTFAFVEFENMAIRNPVTGAPEGPTVEIVKKVCEYAHKQCKFAAIQRKYCWDGEMSEALNGHWFDFCVDIPETSRERSLYLFPEYGLMPASKPVIMARPGSNITEAMIRDPNNDFTLARLADVTFISHSLLDAFYAAGYFVKPSNIIEIETDNPVEGISNLVSSLDNCGGSSDSSVIDLILHFRASIPQIDGEDYVFVAELNITTPFVKLMTRMDDPCLIAWWDNAYYKFICSDDYPEWCEGINISTGHRIDVCQDRSVCWD